MRKRVLLYLNKAVTTGTIETNALDPDIAVVIRSPITQRPCPFFTKTIHSYTPECYRVNPSDLGFDPRASNPDTINVNIKILEDYPHE